MTTTTETQEIFHKKFHFGAPGSFRFVGIWSAPGSGTREHNISAYNDAMASRPAGCDMSCACCGMGIIHHHMVRDSKNEQFAVGSSCIEKLNDTVLLTASKKAELDRQKDIRAQKRADKRQENQRKVEAELDAERLRNDGLTDHEVMRNKRDALEDSAVEQREVVLDELHTALRAAGGNFARDMYRQLIAGHVPTGRARIILIEIMTKTSGRANSKAYKAAYPINEAKFDALMITIEEINTTTQKKWDQLGG